MRVKIHRVDKNLPLPRYSFSGDAGMDLYAAEDGILNPGAYKHFSAGIRIQVPHGYECQIRPRSGIAAKHGISIVNAPGTIDAGYRGLVGVLLINLGSQPFVIKKGDKIAQAVFKKVEQALVEEVEELDASDRGEGGYGHTDNTGPGFTLTTKHKQEKTEKMLVH